MKFLIYKKRKRVQKVEINARELLIWPSNSKGKTQFKLGFGPLTVLQDPEK